MAMTTVALFTYECDWDGCARTADEDGDFVAWSDEAGAWASLTDGDAFKRIGQLWLCHEHWHVTDDGDLSSGPRPISRDSSS